MIRHPVRGRPAAGGCHPMEEHMKKQVRSRAVEASVVLALLVSAAAQGQAPAPPAKPPSLTAAEVSAKYLPLHPVPRDDGEVALENESLRLVVREARIVSLRDKARGVEHAVADAARAPGLFQIRWMKGVQPAGTLDAAAMTARVVRREAGGAEWEFEHAQTSVRAQVALVPARGETHWSIAVKPRDAALAVGHVAFPVLATPSPADDDRKYLLPSFEGRLQAVRKLPLWRTHPAELFSQMFACLGPAGGFVLWTDDGEGNVKAFGFERKEGVAAFAVRHLMPYAAGREWTMPYRTRLTLCGGAWQDAADVYRDWATVQPWSGTPVRERKDLPELLKRPPLCISTQIEKENLDTLPDRLAEWGRRFNAPVVYRPLGWEKHGNWVGIDYLPPSTGEKRFRDLAAKLGERDIAMAGFISGYRWCSGGRSVFGKDLGRETDDALKRFFAEHNGAQVCERTREGSLLDSYGGDGHRICRGTPFGRSFLQSTAASLLDLGFTIIHDDQDHGPCPGGQESCFDATHGHPVPCGPWSTAVTREAFRAIRAEAERRKSAGFLLTKESCTDLLNMDLHAYQARNFHDSTNPDLVPLAQYLFHDRIPVVFGWVTADSGNPRDLAAMLVYGQVPSLAFWNAAARRPDDVPPAGLQVLDDYFASMRTHAKDFLLYGRMRRPLIADVPATRREIPAAKGDRKGQSRTVTLPLVLQSAWDDGRGNIGVFAVNTQDREVPLAVPAPSAGAWQATFYIGAVPQQTRTVTDGDTLQWQLPVGRLASIVFARGR